MTFSQSTLDEIMRDYERRRRTHIMEAREKRDDFLKSQPELKALEDTISELCVKKVSVSLSGDMAAITALDAKIKELRSQKQQILSAINTSAADFDPVFDCPDCQDTGYIGNKRCHCLEEQLRVLRYQQSNINEILAVENFDTYTDRFYSEEEKASMADILKQAKAFTDNFDTNPANLLLMGNVGAGKTFTTNCIAKALLDKNYSVAYYTAYQLFELIADRTFSKGNETNELFSLKDILEYDLLIIDDLGAELSNSFIASKLFVILNERILNKKSVIISTNLTIEQLGNQYSYRSLSRILGNYTAINFTNSDIRIKMRGL